LRGASSASLPLPDHRTRSVCPRFPPFMLSLFLARSRM
jgi:hypothetical protein